MQPHTIIMQPYIDCLYKVRGFALFIFSLSAMLASAIEVRSHSSLMFHGLLFAIGWYSWTFFEYILHRFYMHNKNDHFALSKTHQHHHTHPNEIAFKAIHRLVMVLIIGVLILISAQLNNYFTLLAGFMFGIEGYLFMHRILHLKSAQRLLKKQVRYHIYHHCKYPHTCFGISVTWWDDIFRTVPYKPKINQRVIDFYFRD